jgi:tetratricopeptide (TPR) repeat protein
VDLPTAAEREEDRWEPYFVGGCVLLDAGYPALAAGYFSETAHYNPRAVIGWICLGDCFQSLKLYDQALFYYQQATELEPTHEVALARQHNCVPML